MLNTHRDSPHTIINPTMKKLLSLSLLLVGVIGLHAAEPVPPAWVAPLKADLEKMALELDAKLKPWPVPDRVVRVEDHGAVADGQTLNTAAIQKAIDACSTAGGGYVLLSKGDYVSGTIVFRSGVMLKIEKGSRLLGSTNLADYPVHVAQTPALTGREKKHIISLIFAERSERIGICGEGEIDGRGGKKTFPDEVTPTGAPGRPLTIRILECSNVTVEDITLRNSPLWIQNYVGCENLLIQRISVNNSCSMYNDGMDIEGCRNVIVRDSKVNSMDDSICFKSRGGLLTENVLVENCKASGGANRIKIGTETAGDFRNVLVRNVDLNGGSSGIAWESADGATVENVLVTNARINDPHIPIFISLTGRCRVADGMPKPAPGKIRRLIFENITSGKNRQAGSMITGLPDHQIEDVYFNNISLNNAGGGTAEDAARILPLREKNYPEGHGKVFPSYGFFIRYAANITFQNAEFPLLNPDARPALVLTDDVTNVTLNGTPLSVGSFTANGTPFVVPPPTPSPTPVSP